jgi:hypothetical protein
MKTEHEKKAAEQKPEKNKDQYERLTRDADRDRKEKKPGSQSQSSGRHNNGRGGGK